MDAPRGPDLIYDAELPGVAPGPGQLPEGGAARRGELGQVLLGQVAM